jgi:hypothetical protein
MESVCDMLAVEENDAPMLEYLSLNRDLEYLGEIDAKLLAILYLRHIYRRIHEYNFNFLGMITGKHRTGKSLTALTLSDLLDSSFADNLEDRVVYYPSDFMAALQKIKAKGIVGGAIVWDEAGVGIPAREWYDISNKSISMTLQVFGRYRPIVFFVTPDVTYIDSQARKLFHGFYELSRFKTDYATAKCFDVRYNKRSTKVFYVYSRFHLKYDGVYGANLILKKINIRPPKSELEDRYEVHSKSFKDRIITQMEERTERFQKNKIEPRKMTMDEIVNKLVENKDNPLYLTKRSTPDNVIFDAKAISFDFDLPARVALHIKRRAEIIVNKIPVDKQITENLES